VQSSWLVWQPGLLLGEFELCSVLHQVGSLIEELAEAGGAELGISLQEGYAERLHAYSRSVAHFPTAMKEFKWRNGWFYELSKRAMAAGKSDPLPLHTAMLREVGAVKD
jgi:hypothetical protein